MAQVTIYLDDATEKAAREAAAAAKMPLSRWFAQFAERERQDKREGWQSLFDEIDQVDWSGLPSLEEIRASEAADTPRETF